MKQVIFTVELSGLQAWALAQLVKRISWKEVRINAVNDNEAYEMIDAIARLQASLADTGYAPR